MDILSRQLCEPAWHPDGGSLLAAPGQDGEVVVYERLSWRQTAVLSLARGSSQRLVAFSPNGLYLAAADEDDYVRVVALQGGQALGARLLPGAAACLTWHPSSNALLLATENGDDARGGGCWAWEGDYEWGCVGGNFGEQRRWLAQPMEQGCERRPTEAGGSVSQSGAAVSTDIAAPCPGCDLWGTSGLRIDGQA